MDKDGNGTISLSEYFGIFEDHGITVNKAETNRLDIGLGMREAYIE